MSPNAPLFIVMNAHSGRRGARSACEPLRERLRQAAVRHELLLARRPGELSALAARGAAQALREDGVVVAAGGDGTIRTVAQEALPRDVPFGVLPFGTFNYFAHNQGLPLEPAGAAEALLAGVRAGSVRAVRAALVNERVFLVNASFGLYRRLLEERERHTRRYGRLRIVAMASGLVSLLRGHPDMLLRIEHAGGHQSDAAGLVRACGVFVGNNALQLEEVGLPEADCVRHGELAVVMFSPMSLAQRVLVGLRGLLGDLGAAPEVASFACRRLGVEPAGAPARTGVRVATDGESVRLDAPLVFRISPHRLRLVVPPSAE